MPAAFIDGIDSFYQAVKARIVAANASRVVAGMLEAQDWPPNNVKLEAFYLLTLGESPAAPEAGSIANPQTHHLVQWVWLVKGSNVSQTERMRNRGDRFRISTQMVGELINALYPQFCEKKSWSVSSQGVWSGTSQHPVTYINWTRPQFTRKLDKDSGLVYGAASVHIVNMLDQISA